MIYNPGLYKILAGHSWAAEEIWAQNKEAICGEIRVPQFWHWYFDDQCLLLVKHAYYCKHFHTIKDPFFQTKIGTLVPKRVFNKEKMLASFYRALSQNVFIHHILTLQLKTPSVDTDVGAWCCVRDSCGSHGSGSFIQFLLSPTDCPLYCAYCRRRLWLDETLDNT